MTKRQHDRYERLRELQSAGWQVTKGNAIRPNSGSETQSHWQAKAAVAYVLEDRGLGYSSEVTNDETGATIDILWHGPADGSPVAIEVETKPTRDVISEKIEKYVTGEPVRDVFILAVEDCPDNFTEAVEWAEEELFG